MNKTNVRFILTDDQGVWAASCYGNPEIRTPNLDRLDDPDERHNLIDEPGQKEQIAQLEAMMDEWFARYVDPSKDGLRQDGATSGQTALVR